MYYLVVGYRFRVSTAVVVFYCVVFVVVIVFLHGRADVTCGQHGEDEGLQEGNQQLDQVHEGSK